jgi:MFS family permease
MTAKQGRDMTDVSANRGRWAVAAMFFLNGLTIGAWAPQIPLLLPKHQIGEAALGLLILGLGIGAVGAMLFSGRLIARFGSRRVTLAFAFAAVPGLPLMVLAPGLVSLALAMALFGAVQGSMDVAMNANAVLVERRLGRAIMSSSHGFWSLGGFVGSGLGGMIVARSGAPAQAGAVAALCLTLVLVARPFLLADAPEPSASKPARPDLLPRDAALWILGFLALISMLPEGAVLDWAAIYLSKVHGAGIAQAALAFALFSAAMAVMRFGGDALRNRFGAVKTLRASALTGALGLAVAALAPDAALVIAGFAIAGVGVANVVPIMFSAAGNLPGHVSGAGIATVTMLGYSGLLVSPSSIGFVAEAAGFRPVYLGLALLLAVVALMARRAEAAEFGQL